MRRLLLLLVPLLTAAEPAMSVEASIHEKCLKATDYKGCVEVMGGAYRGANLPFEGLIDQLKMLSVRLDSVSLSTLSTNAVSFRDVLSLIVIEDAKTDHDRYLLDGAKRVDRMISALASAWQTRIYDATQFTSGSKYVGPSKYFLCRYLEAGVRGFNIAAPMKYQIPYNGRIESGFLVGKMEKCSPQEWQMIDATQKYIAELTVDPKVRAKQLETKKRREELCKMEPWARHLEKNPGLKQWASSNPGPAAREREKFLADPNNKKSCGGSLFSSERYRPSHMKTGTCDLSGFKYTSDVCQDDPCNPTCR